MGFGMTLEVTYINKMNCKTDADTCRPLSGFSLSTSILVYKLARRKLTNSNKYQLFQR